MKGLICPRCHKYLVVIDGKEKCLSCGWNAGENTISLVTPLSSVIFERNLDISELAQKALLKNIDGSFEYCEKRGITPDVISDWELGYVPKGFPYLKEYWWNRILFPIRSSDGKNIIGFGGRTIKAAAKEEGVPKYVNSEESPLYEKKCNLYGYNLVPDGEKVYLCEGYIDVLSMYSHNYLHPVASLGTAFTVQQAQMLKEKTERVCICFDSDEPGQIAVHRGLVLLKNAGFKPENISVFSIEDAKDVDDVLQRGGTFEEISALQYCERKEDWQLYARLLF